MNLSYGTQLSEAAEYLIQLKQRQEEEITMQTDTPPCLHTTVSLPHCAPRELCRNRGRQDPASAAQRAASVVVPAFRMLPAPSRCSLSSPAHPSACHPLTGSLATEKHLMACERAVRGCPRSHFSAARMSSEQHASPCKVSHVRLWSYDYTALLLALQSHTTKAIKSSYLSV